MIMRTFRIAGNQRYSWIKNQRSRFVPALNDRVVRRRYQFIDQSRRRFAIPKVRLYGGDGNFCEHEGGAPELRRTGSTECTACKARHAALEPLCLIAHATFEGFGPIALHEIMTAIEQQ